MTMLGCYVFRVTVFAINPEGIKIHFNLLMKFAHSEAVVRRRSIKMYSEKFHKIHRKTPVPETHF